MRIQYKALEETLTLAAAAREDIYPIRGVPLKRPEGLCYIAGVEVRVDATLTSAATSDAIGQKEFSAILDRLQFFDRMGEPFLTKSKITGLALREFQSFLNVQSPDDPTAISADSNTARAISCKFYTPLRLPFLKNPTQMMPLAAAIDGGTMAFTQCASTVFGTGQTLSAITMYLIFHLEVRDGLDIGGAELELNMVNTTRWNEDSVRLDGRPFLMGLFHPTLYAQFATNDYTHVELRGDNHYIPRQAVDLPIDAYNRAFGLGDAEEAHRPLLTVGADVVPLITPLPASKLSEYPREADVSVSLTIGAGAPALTDDYWLTAVARPGRAVHQARQVGGSNLNIQPEELIRKLNELPVAEGNTGGVSAKRSDIYPWLSKRLAVMRKAG